MALFVPASFLPATNRSGLSKFFSYAFRLCKEQQVVRAARLRIRAAHVEPAERMSSDHRARALAIQVKIANVILGACLVQRFTRSCVDCARETVLRVVSDSEALLEILHLDDRQYRSKNLF